MIELWKHLIRTGGFFAYVKVLLWRHRDLIAYLLLTAAIVFAIVSVQNQSKAADRNNNEQRTAIAQAGERAVAEGCTRDTNTIKQLRKIIIVGRNQIDQYVQDGTITPAQGIRAKQQSDESLKTLPVPDCRKAIIAYRNSAKPGSGQ